MGFFSKGIERTCKNCKQHAYGCLDAKYGIVCEEWEEDDGR